MKAPRIDRIKLEPNKMTAEQPLIFCGQSRIATDAPANKAADQDSAATTAAPISTVPTF